MKRITASSLNYTILLFILITTIISTIIFYNYFLKLQQIARIKKLESVGNCESGLNYLLAVKPLPCYEKFDSILILSENQDSIKIQALPWGGFSILSSTSINPRITIQKLGLCANYNIDDTSATLYLKNKGHPLTLCLNSNIQGKVYVPEAVIKYELMNGQSFSGAVLHKKLLNNSNDSLPELGNYFADLNINQLVSSNSESHANIISNQLHEDSISRSFSENTLIITCENGRLNWDYVDGNIILLADSLLIIPNTCKLNDVIVIGKDIVIENGTSGVMQCFAKNSIIVEDNVDLTYPSGLYLIPEQQENDNNFEIADEKSIFIGENVNHSGIVFSNYPMNSNNKDKLLLNLSKNSTLEGIIYWPGSFQLKGEVSGQVITGSFYIKNAFGFYNNYMANGTISKGTKLEELGFPGLFSNNNAGKIVKWLN